MWTLATLVGLVAAILTAAANIPQVWKCWRTGSSGDLSIWMVEILALGLASWVAYGWLQGDWVIVAANGFNLALVLNLAWFKWRDRRAGRAPARV